MWRVNLRAQYDAQKQLARTSLKPSTHANFANSFPLNGGPLSDLTTRGAPNVENSWSNLGMTALADADDTGSTNGNLE